MALRGAALHYCAGWMMDGPSPNDHIEQPKGGGVRASDEVEGASVASRRAVVVVVVDGRGRRHCWRCFAWFMARVRRQRKIQSHSARLRSWE